jgi:hypothetical protein
MPEIDQSLRVNPGQSFSLRLDAFTLLHEEKRKDFYIDDSELY